MVPVAQGELRDAVLAGDEDAFRRLVEPHRMGIHAHCYRLLGSLHDAEDVLQEVLLRAWRGLGRFDPARPLRPWLYAIATNTSLDVLARRSRRPHDHDFDPYPDQHIEDGAAAPDARYEQREAIELAFVAALQGLPGRQRAVLIARDVLGFSAREVATWLDATVVSVNSALQRARRTMDDRLEPHPQQHTLRALGDARLHQLVERFTNAFETGDVDEILALLSEDATFAMPPCPDRARGRAEIADSWLIPSGPRHRVRYLPTTANGQLAFGAYAFDPAVGCYLPLALDVVTLRGTTISAITAFRTPQLFPRFGLPTSLGWGLEPAVVNFVDPQ